MYVVKFEIEGMLGCHVYTIKSVPRNPVEVELEPALGALGTN